MSGQTWGYSPRQIVLDIAGVGIDGGFGEDEFVNIEKQEDDTVDVAGVFGDVAVGVIHDDRATATITLLQTADGNDKLSQLRKTGRATPLGVSIGAFNVRDLLGRSIHRSRSAWIQKPPTVTYARGPGERVWTIRLGHLETFNGGNTTL